MSSFMSRLQQWLNDPFGKEKIRRHNQVLEAMHQTTVRTQVLSKKFAPTDERRFPVGHMIGAEQRKNTKKPVRRS